MPIAQPTWNRKLIAFKQWSFSLLGSGMPTHLPSTLPKLDQTTSNSIYFTPSSMPSAQLILFLESSAYPPCFSVVVLVEGVRTRAPNMAPLRDAISNKVTALTRAIWEGHRLHTIKLRTNHHHLSILEMKKKETAPRGIFLQILGAPDHHLQDLIDFVSSSMT